MTAGLVFPLESRTRKRRSLLCYCIPVVVLTLVVTIPNLYVELFYNWSSFSQGNCTKCNDSSKSVDVVSKPNNSSCYQVRQDLFLCALFFVQKGKCSLFLSSLQHFDKCHEASQIFSKTEQTFASAQEFWCHFLSFLFSGKWPFWLWEGALSASQSQKGTFLRENECDK